MTHLESIVMQTFTECDIMEYYRVLTEISEELEKMNNLKEAELQIKKEQHEELIKAINNFVVM